MTIGIRPICLDCTHLRSDQPGFTCDAFPDDGIPEDIIMSGMDHRTPHEGDHGIQFEVAPGQEKSLENWLDLIGWPADPKAAAKT